MFASYLAYDDSEEDGESDDVDSELSRQLYYCSSSAASSQAVEESDLSDSEHGPREKIIYVTTSTECTVTNLRNYSVSCGLQSETGQSPEVSSDLEDTEVGLEDWMLLGGPEMEGDRNIQLNLEFRRTHTGCEKNLQKKEADGKDLWVISDKDRHKHAKEITSPVRYFMPGIFLPNFLPRTQLTCPNCRKTGHSTRSCPSFKRRVCCILCGQEGHSQPVCPRRHCPVCGLPVDTHRTGSQKASRIEPTRPNRTSQSLPPCPLLSRCSQHCQRCGLSGHLEEACPDLWKQYHLTTQPGPPNRPRRLSRKRKPAACFNCGRRGHYGHECFRKRNASHASVSSLPYVCHYDTQEECDARQTASYSSVRGLLQMKAQKRTWPVKRRERQETKRLKRQQAREHSTGSSQGWKVSRSASPHMAFKRPTTEKRGGPRWMGRLSDRRQKSGGRHGRNLYPLDSSFGRGKTIKRRRR